VYATCSPAKHNRLRDLGAEPLAYDDERIGELAPQVVFDPVGGEVFERSLAALAHEGRLVTCGALKSLSVSVNLQDMLLKRLRIIGSGGAWLPAEETDRIIDLVATGALHGPVIDRELPLEKATEAHRLIENRETFGKIVLRL
jgi:NADPH:quinone reductase-like Zn-dependent oxidoreductase